MATGIDGIDHYSIRTEDVGAVVAFYGKTLGLVTGPRPPFDFPGAWLYRSEADGQSVGPALVHVIGAVPGANAGLHDYLGERDHAARACAEIDLARDAILPTDDLRGRLRISVPLSFGPTHFAPVLAQMAKRHPQLHIHTVYSDRFVDLIAEGFDCAIRLGYLQDSSLLARRVGPIHGALVASPDYIEAHGAPETLPDLLAHEAVMQGTEAHGKFLLVSFLNAISDLLALASGEC